MSRLRMSRPSWSVPNGWAGSRYWAFPHRGSRKLLAVSWARGSYGAIHCAVAATKHARATITRPTIAALFRRRRFQASTQSERCFPLMTLRSAARCCAPTGVVTVATSVRSSLADLDTRIDQPVRDVHQQIGARDEERVEQGGPHDDRIVARVDRADVLAAGGGGAGDV